MPVKSFLSRGVLALALSAVAMSAAAQTVPVVAEPFEPVSGQAGKDVVWVPTPQSTVDSMLELTKVTASDVLVDLGSGNGITVITAAKKGATAMGVEFNPDMVALARRLASEAGVSDKATFVQGDLFEADLSKATVITLFLLPEINMRLRPSLLELKPGTRIVANSFDMGEWQADETADVGGDCTSYCRALKWIVPAKVAGTWVLDVKTLELTQSFQMLEGTLRDGAATRPITQARLEGTQVRFAIGKDRYVGQVNGNRMQGTVNGSRQWQAARRRS